MKKAIQLFSSVLLTMSVGAISGLATVAGVKGWYTTLVKPSFNPPNYLFGPVWSLLYLLMGISLYLVVQAPKSALKNKALLLFGIQLTLNFFWSIIFFKFHTIGWALIEIIALWIFILTTILIFYKINKPAALLQIPYICWVSFATLLTASIYYLNN